MWIPFTVSIFYDRNNHLSWKDSLDKLNYALIYHRRQIFTTPIYLDKARYGYLERKDCKNKVKIIL